MQADELNKALRAAGTMHNPILPRSAFELFSRAQQADSTDKSNAEILCAWNAAKTQGGRSIRYHNDATTLGKSPAGITHSHSHGL
jgi:hypothetical protein